MRVWLHDLANRPDKSHRNTERDGYNQRQEVAPNECHIALEERLWKLTADDEFPERYSCPRESRHSDLGGVVADTLPANEDDREDAEAGGEGAVVSIAPSIWGPKPPVR